MHPRANSIEPLLRGARQRAALAVGLALALSFALLSCNRIDLSDLRTCRPLAIKFSINTNKNPKTGSRWDGGPRSVQPPDPIGYVVVTTGGKRHGEKIALRKNTYAFRGRFYAKKGVPLKSGSKIEVVLEDKDVTKNERLGRIRFKVRSPRSGSARSKNGVVKMTYDCRSS